LRSAIIRILQPVTVDLVYQPVDLAVLLERCALDHQSDVQGGLPGVGVYLQEVVYLGVFVRVVLLDPLEALIDRLLHIVGKQTRRLAQHRNALALRQARLQQVQARHVGRHHDVRDRLKHLGHLGRVLPTLESLGGHVLASNGHLQAGRDGAKALGPRVKGHEALVCQQRARQITQVRPQLGDGVGNRRARGKDDATPVGALRDLAYLRIHVEGALGSLFRQALDALHGGGKRQVLERVSLVHEQHVDAQILPVDGIVLPVVQFLLLYQQLVFESKDGALNVFLRALGGLVSAAD